MKKFLIIPLVSSVLFSSYNTENNTRNNTEYITRNATIDKSNIELDSLLEKFDDGFKNYDYENNTLEVKAIDYVSKEDNNYIVNMSSEELDNDYLDSLDNCKLTYNFLYNPETYNMTVEVSKEQDNIIETDSFTGYAFTNLKGEVDFRFLIDDEIVYLSDIDEGTLVKTGWLSRFIKAAVSTVVAAVIAAVVVFAPPVALLATAIYATVEIAEKSHAVINYKHNKDLRLSKPYIYDQSKLTDWRFGAWTLDQNGCGIVATYNTLKLLGKNPNLASIIYDFDFRSGTLALGFFDSDPSHVREYLNLCGKNVSTYFSFESLGNNLQNGQVAIVCQMNNKSKITDGGHFYVIHKSNNKFYTYNWRNSDNKADEYSTFVETYDTKSLFIVGYIVK